MAFYKIKGYVHLNKKVKDNCVLLNNASIPRADTFTCLGVDLDEKLSWQEHIEKICGKVSARIGMVRDIKLFLPPVTLRTIYKILVQPYFDYCLPLWDNCSKLLQDKFQNRAARIITGASYNVRSADVLDTLGWETLDASKSILMYKLLNDHTAPNLKDLFCKNYETHQNAYNLQNRETDLMLAKPEFLKRKSLHVRWLNPLVHLKGKYSKYDSCLALDLALCSYCLRFSCVFAYYSFFVYILVHFR